MRSIPHETLATSGIRLAWLAVFAGHGAVFAMWWWVSPGGFGLTHIRFWSNRGVPVVVVIAAGCGAVAALARRRDIWPWLAAPFAGMWASAAVSSKVLFPISAGHRWLLGLLGAGILVAWCLRCGVSTGRCASPWS